MSPRCADADAKAAWQLACQLLQQAPHHLVQCSLRRFGSCSRVQAWLVCLMLRCWSQETPLFACMAQELSSEHPRCYHCGPPEDWLASQSTSGTDVAHCSIVCALQHGIVSLRSRLEDAFDIHLQAAYKRQVLTRLHTAAMHAGHDAADALMAQLAQLFCANTQAASPVGSMECSDARADQRDMVLCFGQGSEGAAALQAVLLQRGVPLRGPFQDDPCSQVC